MLTANNKNMVGPTNIQAIALSDNPFTFLATRTGVALAMRSIVLSDIPRKSNGE